MWKYEPEDHGDNKNHLKGKQFKTDPDKYTPAVTSDHEFDNDGNPIFPEPKETPREYKIRTSTNKRDLGNEHLF